MGGRGRKNAARLKPDGLHSEFQVRADYFLRLCLNITNKTMVILQSERHLNRIVSQVINEVLFRVFLMTMPGSVCLLNPRSSGYSSNALFSW